jgi:anion-transporting  ArsA/GET3 family ATPase
MQSLLDRRLLVVTGKGGVGKTTIAAAIGLAAAISGRRTILVEMGEEGQMARLLRATPAPAGVECQLRERLSAITIDPDRALLEWLQALGGRISGRVLASSGTFQYFTAAAPGARELVSMVKIWQLTRGDGHSRRGGHDLVVLDAPATGHALGLLASPQTFGAIARAGPIAGHTRQVRELLEDPERSAYLAVALGTEMAVTEALELQEGLQRQMRRDLSAVIVNGLLPRRFTTAELGRIAAVANGVGATGEERTTDVRQAAVNAARSVHERARFQQNQLARLRRREFDVVGVPFVWNQALDESALLAIAERLARKL